MKKFLALALVAMFAGAQAEAQEYQLSQAEPTSNTIRVGNRPGQGSFGLYMGVTSDMFKDMFEKGTTFKSLPLVNLKYMVTDRVEARLGLQFYKKSETVTTSDEESDFRSEYVTSTNRLYPGVAYHFANSNILDVYAGTELLIGWHRDKLQTLVDGDYAGGAGSMNSFQFGGGLFIGLQAFIGDLPLALGVEYGFHGYTNTGLKYKMATAEDDYYVSDGASFEKLGEISGKDMGARKTQFGQQVRFTVSYYFNR